MASNRAKGASFEIKIKKYLESVGWQVERAKPAWRWTPHGGFGGPNDFFGCFDLICVHPNRFFVLFIQATNSDDISHRKRKCEGFRYNRRISIVQIWGKSDSVRGAVRVFQHGHGTLWKDIVFKPVTGVECLALQDRPTPEPATVKQFPPTLSSIPHQEP